MVDNHADSTAPKRRKTWQRDAVREALAGAEGFVSAQELHRILEQQNRRIGLATVYRALTSLAEDGEADSLRTADGERYRSCDTESHHHHLICRVCTATVEIEAPEVEAWLNSLARKYGYRDLTHDFEAFGVCPDCAKGAE